MDAPKLFGTDQEKIDWILEVFRRDGGRYAGELVFEFTRCIYSDVPAVDDYETHGSDLRQAVFMVDWERSPQGREFWIALVNKLSDLPTWS